MEELRAFEHKKAGHFRYIWEVEARKLLTEIMGEEYASGKGWPISAMSIRERDDDLVQEKKKRINDITKG